LPVFHSKNLSQNKKTDGKRAKKPIGAYPKAQPTNKQSTPNVIAAIVFSKNKNGKSEGFLVGHSAHTHAAHSTHASWRHS
jgi:hypothetical protein